MKMKPNISGGIGPFTPRAYNKIAQVVNAVEDPKRFSRPNELPKVFLAVILEATVIITGRRWKYTWCRANMSNSTMTFQSAPMTDLSYSSNQVYAYNGCEGVQQAAGTKDGPGLTHTNIPSGLALQPIANGTCVLMLMVNDSQGVTQFVFSTANAIDGTCS